MASRAAKKCVNFKGGAENVQRFNKGRNLLFLLPWKSPRETGVIEEWTDSEDDARTRSRGGKKCGAEEAHAVSTCQSSLCFPTMREINPSRHKAEHSAREGGGLK